MRRNTPAHFAWLSLWIFASVPLSGYGNEQVLPSRLSTALTAGEAARNWDVDFVSYRNTAIGQNDYAADVNYYSNNGCHLCPCTYAWAEGLIVGRNNSSSDQPLVLDLNTNEELLTTNDLDFDWTGGIRVGYGFRVCDCWGLEFGYVGIFDHSATARVELEDGLTLPDDLGLQVNNFFAADRVDVEYESDLHSAEVSFVHCCCVYDCCNRGRSVEWIAGLRYLSLNEGIGLTADDSEESTSEYRVETHNDLYGAQLGARFRLCPGRWNWEATGKAGIYGNDMEQRQAPIIDFPDFEFRSAQDSDDGDVAFVGDLNFTAIYQLSRIWGLRAGYNLIWIEGVALAPDQLDFTNTTGSGTGLDDGGGVFLHGLNFGLEARR